MTRTPQPDLLRALAIAWRDANNAYLAEIEKGPVVPPDEPDFGPWERMEAAHAAFWAAVSQPVQDEPGPDVREAVVGPFTFGVNTADGLTLAFGIRIGRWSVEWSAGPAQGLL
jgi:hypothetical protein